MKALAKKIPGLEVELLHEGRALVITLVGRMDPSYFNNLNELLHDTVKSDCRYFVGDLSQGTHLSSTGVGFFGYYSRQIKERGGEVIVVKPPQRITRVIELTRLGELVKFFDTREEALAYVEKALRA